MAYRTKPEVYKERAAVFNPPRPQPDNDSMACVWFPVITVISYFVLAAIVRVISDSGSRLDQIICCGALIFLVILMLLGARDWYKDSRAVADKRQQWKNACRSDELAIANRGPGGMWDDGYRFHTARCWLELERNADQRAVEPYGADVRVEVRSDIYDKLEKRDRVRIYYRPESPLTFLLEEEV